MVGKNFQFLDHTSEVKFRARGNSLEEMYESVVLAFSDFVRKGEKVRSAVKREIRIEGDGHENFLYKFLEELIYLFDAEHFVVVKGRIRIDGNEIEAVLEGDDASRYEGLDHVKAATYSEMYVQQVGEMWEAQVVLDV